MVVSYEPMDASNISKLIENLEHEEGLLSALCRAAQEWERRMLYLKKIERYNSL